MLLQCCLVSMDGVCDLMSKQRWKKRRRRSYEVKKRGYFERERERVVVSAGGLVLRKRINLEVFILYINS
jgi:hypothetical protein